MGAVMQWIDVSNEVLGKLKYLLNILKVPEGPGRRSARNSSSR